MVTRTSPVCDGISWKLLLMGQELSPESHWKPGLPPFPPEEYQAPLFLPGEPEGGQRGVPGERDAAETHRQAPGGHGRRTQRQSLRAAADPRAGKADAATSCMSPGVPKAAKHADSELGRETCSGQCDIR